jgi:hypothetical protein
LPARLGLRWQAQRDTAFPSRPYNLKLFEFHLLHRTWGEHPMATAKGLDL